MNTDTGEATVGPIQSHEHPATPSMGGKEADSVGKDFGDLKATLKIEAN
jgi:hypothetical protein